MQVIQNKQLGLFLNSKWHYVFLLSCVCFTKMSYANIDTVDLKCIVQELTHLAQYLRVQINAVGFSQESFLDENEANITTTSSDAWSKLISLGKYRLQKTRILEQATQLLQRGEAMAMQQGVDKQAVAALVKQSKLFIELLIKNRIWEPL